MTKWPSILKRILAQLSLRAEVGQSGNVFEINSPAGSGGDMIRIHPNGHVGIGYVDDDLAPLYITNNDETLKAGFVNGIRMFIGDPKLTDYPFGTANTNPLSGGFVGYYVQIVSTAIRQQIWGMNPVVSNSLTLDAYMFGIETDVSNYNANVPDPRQPFHKMGCDSVSGGDHMCSAAYGVNALTAAASWRHGMWMDFVGNGQAGTTLMLTTNSCSVTYGIDISRSIISTAAIRLPNNSAIVAKNAANNADTHLMSVGGDDSIFVAYLSTRILAGFSPTCYVATGSLMLGQYTGAPTLGLDIYGGSARLHTLPTPAAATVSTSTTGGTLAAATYLYWVVAEDRIGLKTVASTSVSQVTTGTTSSNTITISQVTGGVKYYVLRKATAPTPGATETILVGTTILSNVFALATVVDTGAALTTFTSGGRNNTGDMTVDGAVIGGTGYTNAVVNFTQSTCYVATANAATTTTAETKSLVGTGLGSMTAPAQSLAVGETFELEAEGFWTTGATAGTVTFQMKIGSVVIATTGAIAPTISMTTRPWRFKQRFTVRAVGSGTSANVFAQGKGFEYEPATPSTATTASTTWQTVNTAVSSGFDSTIANLIDFQSITSNALHTITCTNLTLKRAA